MIIFKTMLEGELHHSIELDGAGPVDYRSVIGCFVRQLLEELHLVGGYNLFYPRMRDFMREGVFEGELAPSVSIEVRSSCATCPSPQPVG